MAEKLLVNDAVETRPRGESVFALELALTAIPTLAEAASAASPTLLVVSKFTSTS
jgi:hypothetical protein